MDGIIDEIPSACMMKWISIGNGMSTSIERNAKIENIFDRKRSLTTLIRQQKPIIFDVGSNSGASVREFKNMWPSSEIHCFEPQEECWEELTTESQKYDEGIVKINKYAVGSEESENTIFYSHDITTGQSGLHKINVESKDSIDLAQKIEKQEREQYKSGLNRERRIHVRRLSDYLIENQINNIDLLKIDTQGHEPEVLKGLGDKVKDVSVVLTELMFYDFYEKKVSFFDIENILKPAGFCLYDISFISKNPANGRTDWVDAIYVNENLKSKL